MTTRASPPHWWQWPTILSLDAPAVAVVWQWLFAALAGVALGWPERTVLGLSVWLAYAADRWIEGWRLRADTILTPRHQFYARNLSAVAVIWIVLFCADVMVAFLRLDRRELMAGGILLVPVLLYIVSHQMVHRESRWRVPKEILIALLISAGAVIFILPTAGAMPPLLAALGLFAALCFVNVALIAVWEEEVDAVHGQSSLARQFTHASTLIPLLPLGLTGAAAFAASPWLGVPPVAAHCVAASAILLAIVHRFEPVLGWQRARVLADAVLLTPLVPLLRSSLG